MELTLSNSSATFRYGEKRVDLIVVRGDCITPSIHHLIKQVRSSYKLNWGGIEENDQLIWNAEVDESPETTHYVTKIYDQTNGLTKIVTLTKRTVSLQNAKLPGDVQWWQAVHKNSAIPLAQVLRETLPTATISVFTRLAAYTPYKVKRATATEQSTENDTIIGVATMLKSSVTSDEVTLWTIGPILRDKVLSITHNSKTVSLDLSESLSVLGLAESHKLALVRNNETLALRTTYPGYWNDLDSLRAFVVRLFQEKLIHFDELPAIFFDGLEETSSALSVERILQKLHYYDVQHLSPLLQGKITLRSGFTVKALQDRLFAEVQHGPISALAFGEDCLRNAESVLDLVREKYKKST